MKSIWELPSLRLCQEYAIAGSYLNLFPAYVYLCEIMGLQCLSKNLNHVHRVFAGIIIGCHRNDDYLRKRGKEVMADDTSQEKKQPLWHKWWFWMIVVVVLVLGIIGSQEESSQTPVSAISSTTMSTSPSQSAAVSSSPSESEQQDSLKVLNSVAQSVGIEPSDVVSYKPDEEHNQNGPYSRVEYRLPAFQGSSGVHATLNGASVDVVTYHQSDSNFVRIYAMGDENTVLSIYSAAASVFDSSLSDSDLQAAIAKYRSSEAKDSRDNLTNLSANGKIQSDYIIGSGSNCEIFIDAKA